LQTHYNFTDAVDNRIKKAGRNIMGDKDIFIHTCTGRNAAANEHHAEFVLFLLFFLFYLFIFSYSNRINHFKIQTRLSEYFASNKPA